MKKNILAFLTVFLVLLLASCVDELDETTSKEINPDPIESADTYVVDGTVRDTSGNLVPGAKMVLFFDDLELETESDEDGYYAFFIPNSKTEGLVLTTKSSYKESINAIRETDSGIEKSIYLLESPSAEVVQVLPDSLLTISGRTLNESGQPMSDVLVAYLGWGVVNGMENISGAVTYSNANGDYEIILEKQSRLSNEVTARHPGDCGGRLAQYWYDDVSEKVIDDFYLYQRDRRYFATEMMAVDCNSDLENKVYRLGTSHPRVYDEPIGPVDLGYCIEEEDEAIFYAGVESSDGLAFDGIFISENDIEAQTIFNPCLPAEEFLEVIIEGDTTVYTDLTLNTDSGTLISANEPHGIFFWMTKNFSSSTGGVEVISGGRLLDVTRFEDLQTFYTLDQSYESIVNYIDYGPVRSGVGYGRVVYEADNSTADMKIRFRVTE